MNIRRWLHEHSLKLLAIRDTPEAIAGGVAIGIFFGFTPLFGFKTILAIGLAWLTRANVLAAVIATTLHDILWPFIPAILWAEYAVGYWVLHQPHHFPPARLDVRHPTWAALHTIAGPMLLGSVVFGGPSAAAAYFLTRRIVIRHHRKRHARPSVGPGEANPG